MNENRIAPPLTLSVVGTQWVQAATSTSRGTTTLRVETADVGLRYLSVPTIPIEPRIQVGHPVLSR